MDICILKTMIDSLFDTLNVSVILGTLLGGFLACLVLGCVILLHQGGKKVTIFSCVITAFFAAFMSMQSSLFIGELRLKNITECYLNKADTAVRFMSEGSSFINGISTFAENVLGMRLVKLPEMDPETITKLQDEIDTHRIRHIYYMIIGAVLAAVLLYFTMDSDETGHSKGKHARHTHSGLMYE